MATKPASPPLSSASQAEAPTSPAPGDASDKASDKSVSMDAENKGTEAKLSSPQPEVKREVSSSSGQGAPRRTVLGNTVESTTGRIDKSKLRVAIEEARKTVSDAAARNPRRTRLELRKIDPWSAMKFAFAASFVLAIMFVVAASLLYTILDAMGVFSSINDTISSLTSSGDGGQSREDIGFEINGKLVIGGSALLGAVNIILFTAMAALGAFIYNVCADLAGGLEVTLAERE